MYIVYNDRSYYKFIGDISRRNRSQIGFKLLSRTIVSFIKVGTIVNLILVEIK